MRSETLQNLERRLTKLRLLYSSGEGKGQSTLLNELGQDSEFYVVVDSKYREQLYQKGATPVNLSKPSEVRGKTPQPIFLESGFAARLCSESLHYLSTLQQGIKLYKREIEERQAKQEVYLSEISDMCKKEKDYKSTINEYESNWFVKLFLKK
jgi:hypothetical protein